MFLDALGLVSDAQAFGAGAVSTNSVDLGIEQGFTRQIGEGEPMGFGIAIDVLAVGTTVIVEIISATDAALTAGVRVHGRLDGLVADFPAGSLHFVAFNRTTSPLVQRFVGVRITTAAGTITATCWLTSHALFSVLARPYPKRYSV
jgi:hypothetical protein